MRNLKVLNSFWIRIIAIITMVIDHIAVILEASLILDPSSSIYLIMRIIGRISFPLFALGIFEGITHTKNVKKYLLRLTIMFAIVASGIAFVTYGLKMNLGINGNIFSTLLLGAILIYLLKLKNKKTLLVIPLIVLIGVLEIPAIPSFLKPDYSLYGIALILFYYLGSEVAEMQSSYKANKLLMTLEDYKLTTSYQGDKNLLHCLAIICVNLLFYMICKLIPYFDGIITIDIQSFSIIAIFIVILYNGRRGYDSKWFRVFNYLFYPLHLIIIFGLMFLI